MAADYDVKQQERERAIARARWRKIMRCSIWTALIAVAVAGTVFALVRFNQRSSTGPGMTIPDQGAQHVSLGTPFDYNSNPPTSGPHHASPAEWGVYKEEIHDQILIHNLEHGGIWVAYKPGVSPDVISRLEAVASEFGRKVIMAPRPANDADIALAAWNHLDKFSAAEFSEERVRNFIKAYRNRGPEFVP
ncbi:MAG: DUF3105 domain-containing protein [Patescibacteria group bacterium]